MADRKLETLTAYKIRLHELKISALSEEEAKGIERCIELLDELFPEVKHKGNRAPAR